MNGWHINLDGDWQRLGFDPRQLSDEGLEVGHSERLAAETLLVAVLIYVGGKILDQVTDEALTRGIRKLASFARSKDKRLLLELEAREVDPRVKAVFGRIEGDRPEDFEAALTALPMLKARSEFLLAHSAEYVDEVWYVWSDSEWKFTYLLTEGGAIVDKEPGKES
jgi:hypothetical protein